MWNHQKHFYKRKVAFSEIHLEIQGVSKQNGAVFILKISWQPSTGFSNSFFLLKTKINTQILSTNPFLCNFLGLRYFQNKMSFLIRLF